MFTKLYFTALIAFFAIDMLWLGVIAKNFYKQQIGFLMKAEINWVAAIIFYLLFIFGLVWFVILPGVSQGNQSVFKILLSAALFGVVCYATYDLTNLATLKNWPFAVTIIDLLWGGAISVLVTLITISIWKN